MNPAPRETILVIGATGNVGRHLLAQLRARGASGVRALVRPGTTAHRPDGVDVATGSLDAPDSLAAALTGVNTVFRRPRTRAVRRRGCRARPRPLLGRRSGQVIGR
jgi:uncharacterized protein YbjT (DUF2867 family)